MGKDRPIDVTMVTQADYLEPEIVDGYVANVLLEDKLVRAALEKEGLNVDRTSWDDKRDWTTSHIILIRAIWDYFHRWNEFSQWLERTQDKVISINPFKLIRWNAHKFYLKELSRSGVRIPPTLFIKSGVGQSLEGHLKAVDWKDVVLKPAISGAGRHTYKFSKDSASEFEGIFSQLLAEEDVLLQEFQPSIQERGEAALMFIDGQFTHAVLKRAKRGDFRVQDDFGGTVEEYVPTREEVELARKIIALCPEPALYGRVDLFWNTAGDVLLGELEVIEPEMWFRYHPSAADLLAKAVAKRVKHA
jgi:glutathione synthase/RimK-type ligase-like ATP-grasp enzyme